MGQYSSDERRHVLLKAGFLCIMLFSGISSSKAQDLRQSAGESSLIASIQNHSVDEAQRLLEEGVDPNFVDSLKISPLRYAIRECDTAIAGLLIAHVANVNEIQMRDLQLSLLHEAVEAASTSLVSLLLHYGAKSNIEDVTKSTPLHLAAIFAEGNSNKRMQALSDQMQFGDSTGRTRHDVYGAIIGMLLKNGASPNIADKWGGTPLFSAARCCDTPLIKILLRYGADRKLRTLPYEKGRNGYPPGDQSALDAAVMNGCTEAIELLR